MRLIQILTCTLSAVVMVTQSLFWFVPFYIFAILRLLIPIRASRKFFARTLVWVGGRWMNTTRHVLRWIPRIQFEVEGLDSLVGTRSYLILANHQSWADTMVLTATVGPHVPLLRFFAKRQLIWLPFFGLAFWALDYPFMRRHSREFIARHPEQRGKDLETTRRLCKKFRTTPVTIVNFAEGTRFTPAKHEAQGSPYRHLLRPRAGGIAFALAAMEGRIDRILDLTIVYPPGTISFFGLFSGRMKKIVVDVRERSVPKVLLEGDYLGDTAHREMYQAWIREIWKEKDDQIDRIRVRDYNLPPLPAPVVEPGSPVSPAARFLVEDRPDSPPKATVSERT
jgi:1-acyl-sn-glycerol-3-phosphate acyltransferase